MNLNPPPPSPPFSNSNPHPHSPLGHSPSLSLCPFQTHTPFPPPRHRRQLTRQPIRRPISLHNVLEGTWEGEQGTKRWWTAFRAPRTGSGSGSSFGYERKAVGGSKSLVDDEAELSDWVSELRTDPNRHGGGWGVESDGNPRGRVRDRGRDRDREAYPAKRSRRDSSGGGGEFGESRTRGGFRSSRSNSSSLSKRGGRGGRAVDSGFRRGSATGGGRDAMKAMRVVDESEDDEVNEKIEGPKPKQRNEQ